METSITVALIMSFASIVGSIFIYRKGAKKDEVDALRNIIAELKNYVDDLECDKEDLQLWAERLVAQVKEAGMEPAKFERKTTPRKRGAND
jgi:hypothetical protein